MKSTEIARLEAYMNRRFGIGGTEIRQIPGNDALAEVHAGGQLLGRLERDDEDGDLSYDFSTDFQCDADKVQAFMRERLGIANLEVRQRTNKDDSAEVYVEDEFIGVVFVGDDAFSYSFNMSILEYDLEEA